MSKKSYGFTTWVKKKPADATDVSGYKTISVKSKRSVDLRLYRKTQVELREHILQVLKSKSIPHTVYDGNIYSVRFPDRPMFVAHMDMIREESAHKPLYVSNGELHRDGGTLGADDRAGVNMILNHIEQVNFCFTRDEETGCNGTHSLMEYLPFLEELEKVNCLIEPDRKSDKDIIEYCNEDLTEVIMESLPTYRPANGVWTDVAVMKYLKAGVNLSCGYYNAHSDREYLNIAEYETLNDLIPVLAMIEGTFEPVVEVVLPIQPTKSVYNPYADDWDAWDRYYDSYLLKEEIKEQNEDVDLDELKDVDRKDLLTSEEYVLQLKGNLDPALFTHAGYCDLCQAESPEVGYIEGLFICADCVSSIVTKLTINVEV